MEPIKLNLATFEYLDKRFSYPMMLIVAGIVLLISSLSIKAGLNALTRIREIESKITEQEQMMQKKQQIKQVPKLKEEEMAAIKNNVNFINGIIIQHSYPYDKLLDSLEVSVPRGVVLVSFSQSKDLNKVVLDGKADTMNDITLFLNNLGSTAVYKSSNIMNLSVSQDTGAQEESASAAGGITFEIESVVAKDQVWK